MKVQVGKDRAGQGGSGGPGGSVIFFFENLDWIENLDWWTNFSLFGVAEHLVLRLWPCFL